MSTRSRLTVYFEPPFWVGVYERESDGKYEAGKLVFGAEPKDFEVLELVQDHWKRIKLSPPVDIEQKPKRMQREISASLSRSGAGTKAQEALKLQYEQNKAKRRAASKERRELEKERRFEQRREKKKEKHRGH